MRDSLSRSARALVFWVGLSHESAAKWLVQAVIGYIKSNANKIVPSMVKKHTA